MQKIFRRNKNNFPVLRSPAPKKTKLLSECLTCYVFRAKISFIDFNDFLITIFIITAFSHSFRICHFEKVQEKKLDRSIMLFLLIMVSSKWRCILSFLTFDNPLKLILRVSNTIFFKNKTHISNRLCFQINIIVPSESINTPRIHSKRDLI